MRSDNVTKGSERAPNRSLFYALGYTKEMITNLKGMPFGVKSIEKRQNELVNRLFRSDERTGVNACRLVTRAFELRILDIDNLEPDEE